MRILAGSRSIREPIGPFAVGLGIFDGVHIGHQQLLGCVCELAASDTIDSLAYTFNPHPAAVLVPERAPRLLEPIENRLEGFAALGLVATLVERFDPELASTTAERFIDEVLIGKLQARHVVVGQGFTFGAGGRGTTALLASRSEFTTHVIPPVTRDGEVVSSTRIRELITGGRVAEAAPLLGRPFTLFGLVMRGLMRGQKLGFPTANLATHNEIEPARGVYAGRASGRFGTFPAVVNIGYTPTFGGSEQLKVEAHLLDFEFTPLYGHHVALELVGKLRDEQRFPGAAALVEQIGRDIAGAREILAG